MSVAKMAANWRNASSIILASSKTRRILMMKRGNTAAFMPDSLVFPGGVVDQNDAKLGDELKICAIRELFEESGILLTKNGFESSSGNPELQKLKRETVENASVFKKFENQIGIDRLIEWDTFLTPASYKKRFFTRFFVAIIDEEPSVDLCTTEMAEFCWTDPKTCVNDSFDGKYMLPPPQVYELTRISQLKQWDSTNYENHANTKRAICPQPVKLIGKDVISNMFPGDYLYQEQNCYHQPLREMTESQVAIQKDQPTHRAVYNSKPLYTKCHLYQHHLGPEYTKVFHQFETHSKFL